MFPLDFQMEIVRQRQADLRRRAEGHRPARDPRPRRGSRPAARRWARSLHLVARRPDSSRPAPVAAPTSS